MVIKTMLKNKLEREIFKEISFRYLVYVFRVCERDRDNIFMYERVFYLLFL